MGGVCELKLPLDGGLVDAAALFGSKDLIWNWSAMGDNPLNARFGEHGVRLTKDLLFDSEGSL